MTDDPARVAIDYAAKRAPFTIGVLPSTFRAAVTGTTEHRQQYRRTAYLIDFRHARLRTSSGAGTKKAEIRPCPNPQAVDPWAVDPASLPSQTQAVTTCPTCAGSKKIDCSYCGAMGKVTCGGCGGRGQVAGQRGPKNCPSCRGKGTRRCDGCNGAGRVQCPPCEGMGRVRAWLEIEAGRRSEIRVHPRDGVARLHRGLDSEQDLDRTPESRSVPQMSDTGWSNTLPPGLGPELLPTFDAHSDRIAARRLQVFGSDVDHIAYRLLTGRAELQVSRQPLRVLAESNWGPWRRRWFLALITGAVVFGAAVAYFGAFTERSQWFALHPNAGLISLMGGASALFAVVTAAGMCLPRHAWGWLRVYVPALALLASWIGMTSVWLTTTPSAEAVSAAVERGELEIAQRELAALKAVGLDDTEAFTAAADAVEAEQAERERQRRQALDDAQLEAVRRAPSTVAAVHSFEHPWEYVESRNEARTIVLARASEDLDALFERHASRELAAIADAIAPHDAGLSARARARQRLAEAHACGTRGDWRCIVDILAKLESLEGDTAAQQARATAKTNARDGLLARLAENHGKRDVDLEVEKKVLLLWLADARAYSELTDEEPPHDRDAVQQRLEKVDAKLEKQREKEEARRRREERKAARAAERAAKRQAAAEARALRRSSRVQCCDGSYSPSCTYGGSLRGCCSHHGGVC